MQDNAESWVVYLMTIYKQPDGVRAVCEQSEWDAMELARPGHHHLIRGNIATEVEAEIFARRDAPAKIVSASGSKPGNRWSSQGAVKEN